MEKNKLEKWIGMKEQKETKKNYLYLLNSCKELKEPNRRRAIYKKEISFRSPIPKKKKTKRKNK